MYQFYRIIIVAYLVFFSLSLSAKENNILILGDSLSASYNIPLEAGWVTLLEKKLINTGYHFNIINASISGETTSGALTRIDQLLKRHTPKLVIIELGGNDGLRGFPFSEIKRNLVEIVNNALETKSEIILVPMQLPPNYGQAYNQKFQQLYVNIAEEYGIALSKFILEDIATNPALMQDDGIHPLANAQPVMLENMWPTIETLINTIE